MIGLRPLFEIPFYEEIPRNSEYTSTNDEETEYGYFPSIATSPEMQEELNDNINKYTVSLGNITTFHYEDEYSNYTSVENPVYEYKGKLYCLKKAEFSYDDPKLSNNVSYNNGAYIWYEINPIKWLVDLKSKKMISKEVIASGVMPKDSQLYYDQIFSKEVHQFDEFFIKIVRIL